MKLTCLVDNAVQPSSGFWGEHGLAYLVEADGQRILFDTGQSGTVLLHNLKLLGIDPVTIDAVAISHGHYDHTGGLPALLGLLRPGIPLFANLDLFRERFAQRDGPPKYIGLPLSREELVGRLTLKLSAAPQEIVPGVWTTGEISERAEFEGRSKGHLMAAEGELVADAYRDDIALVLLAGDRLALLCGCCHAGLLNTLAHVKRTFPQPVALMPACAASTMPAIWPPDRYQDRTYTGLSAAAQTDDFQDTPAACWAAPTSTDSTSWPSLATAHIVGSAMALSDSHNPGDVEYRITWTYWALRTQR